MWVLDNQTPFAAERGWLQDRNGALNWIVAIKGTFVLAGDGRFKVAPEPLPVALVPRYRGEPGLSSLISEADFHLPKASTDVLLEGSAHVPNGKAAPVVDVRLKVGSVDKTLRIFGDRVWKEGLFGPAISSPEPFVTMPIVYERAFGGAASKAVDQTNPNADRRNPVGQSFCVRAEEALGRSLPNVEDPKELVGSWKSRPKPAGFGAVARDWSPRFERAGTHDQAWRDERFPLVPRDFQERFHQAAPDDQQTSKPLVGGEFVELENLTPGGGLSKFEVPRFTFEIQTTFKGGDSILVQPGTLPLQTLMIEPDRKRLVMVWQSVMVCPPSKVRKLLRTTLSLQNAQGSGVKRGLHAG